MIYRLSFVLLLVTLAACSPLATPSAVDSTIPDGQIIVLWHAAEDDIRRALLAQIDEFNATNPWGILVVPEYHGDAAEMASALQAAVDTGRTPDLVFGRPLDTTRLGDAVVPIEPYVTDTGYGLSAADLSDLYPAPLDANRIPSLDHALVGFPVDGEGTVLVYNADRLAASGYLTPPDSWALFREVCLATTIDRSGDRQPDVFGLGFTPRPEFVSAWFLSRGAPLLLPDGRTVGFDGQAGLTLLEVLSESAQGGCFYRTPGPGADLEAFSAGRVAMIFARTSDLRGIKLDVEMRGGFRWGVAPLPRGQQPVTLDMSGRSWIVLRSTPARQLAAWLFVRWFASTDQTLAWAIRTGQLPLRASAADQLKRLYSENPAETAALDLLPFARADPLVPYWPAVAEAVTRAVLSVAAGDAAATAHEQAVNAVKQLVTP